MTEMLTDDEPIFPEVEIKFATFWPRLGATILDSLIIGFFVLPITYLNVTAWKIPWIYILTTLTSLFYKPFMEYRYGATIGKMAARLKVVGYNFERITLNEELKRVSFYYLPSILIAIMTVKSYFSSGFRDLPGFVEFQNYIGETNPAIPWVNLIVMGFAVADCVTFFTNYQRRSLHDMYAGTYVIQKNW